MEELKPGDQFMWTGGEYVGFVTNGLFRVLAPFNMELVKSKWDCSTEFMEYLLIKEYIIKIPCKEIYLSIEGYITVKEIGS